MNKWQLFEEAKRRFEAGENVSAAMKDGLSGDDKRLLIEAVYDLQAGSYSETYFGGAQPDYEAYVAALIDGILKDLGVEEVLDCGIGEATRWVAKGGKAKYHLHGFDISLSRLSFARRNLVKAGVRHDLFTADMFHIPVADNAAECVITMHAMEPNGGMEERIIAELLRVAGRYLVVMEPDFQKAGAEQKERMQRLGYVTEVFPLLEGREDLVIHRYEPVELFTNPLNRASILVAEKKAPAPRAFAFVSPISGATLEQRNGFLYDTASGFAFAELDGIPILKPSDAVFLGHPEAHFGHRDG